MYKRCLQIITALLCVLLLAGCGAAPAKEDDTTRTAPRTQPAQTDNAPTQRGSVMPDVSCQVEWGEGVQPDQVIGDAAQAYFTLLGTALSAPEQPVQSDPSCTDALVQEAFEGVPVYLANDANGAALAELYAGAFRGCRTAVLLTLGTGLGGGIIFGGHMFNGGMNQGVELGHMYLVNGGEHCTCGNDGCMEAYCAASALARDGKRAMLEHPESLIAARAGGAADAVDAKLVIDCAKEGDETAKAVFDRYIDSLSSACASIYNLLDPEVIAIGGGVCGAGEFLFAPLRERTTGKCFYKTHGKLIPAELGNEAGMIGAAMLHRDAQ